MRGRLVRPLTRRRGPDTIDSSDDMSHENARGRNEPHTITTRRYTGVSRQDARAGFRMDMPRISGRYVLLAEAWDQDTHTLTVMLEEIPSPAGQEFDGPARGPGQGSIERQ